MMKALLFVLLSPALPLNCRYTYNKTGMTNNGYGKTTCDSKEDSCVASVLRTNIIELRAQLLNKCMSSDNCFLGNYSFTAGDGKFFEMKKHCCNTELCNNATLSLPDHSVLAENGLKCPACFSEGTTECKSEKTIDCLGNETQCVVFKGALHIDPALDGYLPINIVLRNNAVWRQDKFAKSLLSEKKRLLLGSTISRSKVVEQQIFVPSRKTEEHLDLGNLAFLLPKKDVILLQESYTSLNMKGNPAIASFNYDRLQTLESQL
ncbi:phospholipase A2 inhibitor and Ly6/PLAUR domain-containing protein-like [Podarcis raffonei]|uniref:phospholipase A2 inhibitor and Ly6/PLAUR domain-containing protein-like n=1 Tax=Podarcis raffonei TaxID=65483 RepID=UPI00232977A2|nr:phospholipase A2 inhibitor and Ly6/PLAUR domain-containing protein-like [Podarcis raffonei]